MSSRVYNVLTGAGRPGGPAVADAPDDGAWENSEATPFIEIGGPTGPEPTRYGDWERNGRVSDF